MQKPEDTSLQVIFGSFSSLTSVPDISSLTTFQQAIIPDHKNQKHFSDSLVISARVAISPRKFRNSFHISQASQSWEHYGHCSGHNCKSGGGCAIYGCQKWCCCVCPTLNYHRRDQLASLWARKLPHSLVSSDLYPRFSLEQIYPLCAIRLFLAPFCNQKGLSNRDCLLWLKFP